MLERPLLFPTLLYLASGVTARKWRLPSVPLQPRNLPEHLRILQQLEDLRGGSGYDPREWTTPYDDNPRYKESYGEDDDDSTRDPYRNDHYNDNDDYDSYNYGRAAPKTSSMMPSVLRHGHKKSGFLLLSAGGSITVLGASLFFNKTLMRLGNLFFICGVPLVVGPSRTVGYFMKPEKLRSTVCLVAGIMLVWVGWPILGILLEVFGLLNLFGNMFPLVFTVVKQMPVIGPLLKATSGSGGRRRKRKDSDYYDNDGNYYDDDYRQSGSYNDNYRDDYGDEYRDDDYNKKFY